MSIDYRVNRNTGNSITNATITNQIYTTNGTLATHPGGSNCFNINGVYNWVGYSSDNYSFDYRTVSGCLNLQVSQNFGMSLGGTSNAFPGEFRNFSKLNRITAVIPSGYSFVNARFRQSRSAGGVGGSVNQPYLPISPSNPNSTTLIFDVANNFQPLGTYQLSDDNYSGTFQLTLSPTCAVIPNVYLPIAYTFRYDTVSALGTATTSTSNGPNRDSILHIQPILNLQSTLPSLIASTDTVKWTVIVGNDGIVPATFPWISPVNTSGKVNIFEVLDITGIPTVLTPTNNIYQLPTINAGSSRTLVISAKYTNCNKDSITVNAGWNCGSYPLNLAAYSPCVSKKWKLYLQAIKPVFTASISGPVAPVNLCDTIDYEVTFTNAADGRAYDPSITVRRNNSGITIVPGSCELMYPDGSSYIPISDPTVSGSYYIWNLNSINPEFGTLRIKSAPESPSNVVKIKFKMVTNCSFVSGSFLRFTVRANGGCGTLYSYTFNSQVITIAGAPTNYTTSISTKIDTVVQCGVPINYRVKIVNLGAGTTNSTDRFQIDLPAGFLYLPNSTTDIYQGFTSEPVTGMFSGEQRLRWDITGGVVPGDSIIFNFQVVPDNSLTTGPYANDIQTQLKVILSCGMSTCTISNINGTLSPNTIVNRPVGRWTGQIDTDWFKPENWSDCKIPDCATDVQIPDVTNEPIISTSGTAATQSLLVETNSSVTLNPNAVIHICGDLEVSASSAFNSGLGSEVHFTGSTDQTITLDGTSNFENVFAEQSTPSSIYLNNNLVIDRSLTLTDGVFVTAANEVFVTEGSATAVNAGDNNSYVQGYLRRDVTGTGFYYLPVGNATKGYQLAEIRVNSQGDLTQMYSYFNNWAGTPHILNQSECNALFDQEALNHGFWTIDATVGATNPAYSIYLHNRNYTNPQAGWTIMKKPTGCPDVNYNILEGTCTMASTAPLTIRHNMSTFSDFAVAQSATILPVEMIYLSANPKADHIQLKWATASEGNNAGFEVQKSTNAKDFSPIAFIPGTNSASQSEYQNNDFEVIKNTTYYYRLKQVDINGDFRYSNVVSANISELKNLVSIYPNPANDYVIIKSDLDNFDVVIYNQLGQIVSKSNFINQNGEVTVDLKNLSSGTYLLKVQNAEFMNSTKLIINK